MGEGFGKRFCNSCRQFKNLQTDHIAVAAIHSRSDYSKIDKCSYCCWIALRSTIWDNIPDHQRVAQEVGKWRSEMNICELLNCEALSKVVTFPIKTKDGQEFFYKIKEMNLLTENSLKQKSLKATVEDLKKDGIDINVSKKEDLLDVISEIYKDQYTKNYYAHLLVATSFDVDTDKPIFDSVRALMALNVHKDVFAKMIENYEDFVLESSPYINGTPTEDIEKLVEELKNGASASFLDNATKNYTKRDLRLLSLCLGSKLMNHNLSKFLN